MPTIKQLLTEARTTLKGPDAGLEAELLMEVFCGVSRSRQFSHADDQLSEDKVEQYKSALERRLSGEPLAHITGRRGFWDVDLQVTPDVLIPRPDTEILVEQALKRIPHDADWQIADLGTGSGAIAIAIARERPQSDITATDNSRSSAGRCTGKRHGRWDVKNISFVARLMGPAAGQAQRFDMILSNPPYIRADDPHLAEGDLAVRTRSGTGFRQRWPGCDIRQIICRQYDAHLKPNGWLILEHGYDQAAEVSDLLQHADFNEIFTHKDYGGNDRVTVGRRQNEEDECQS